MQGAPPRAYLLARAPTRSEVLDVAVHTPADAVVAALAKAVADLRLVVFDAAWRAPRVLAQSAAPHIEIDPAQQACFLARPNDLGCCLGDGPQASGCLPKADPPSATLRFDDPSPARHWRFATRYPASSSSAGGRARGETLYWCQGWERASLRGSAR